MNCEIGFQCRADGPRAVGDHSRRRRLFRIECRGVRRECLSAAMDIGVAFGIRRERTNAILEQPLTTRVGRNGDEVMKPKPVPGLCP